MTTKEAILELLNKKIKEMENQIDSSKQASNLGTSPSTLEKFKEACRAKNQPIPSDEELEATISKIRERDQIMISRYISRKNALVAIVRIIKEHLDDEYLKEIELTDLDFHIDDPLDPTNPDRLKLGLVDLWILETKQVKKRILYVFHRGFILFNVGLITLG